MCVIFFLFFYALNSEIILEICVINLKKFNHVYNKFEKISINNFF
jgi:hypothetical protein